jgi:K+-sensing histidine kinase KdpD
VAHLALRQSVRLEANEQAAREEAARAAAAGDEARVEFFRAAAHELRTPLTSLRGYIQILLDQLERGASPGPDQTRRALRVIDEESQRLTRLAAQLNDASRLYQGRLSLALRPVDVAALVTDVVEAARPATYHPLLLAAPAPVWADVDPPRLEVAVRDLLDLVQRHTLNGAPVEVAVSCTPAGEAAVSVGGHDATLPMEYRRHLVDRFTLAAQEHRVEDLGLGLYVSRQIVQAHGGTIRAETAPEGGNRFVLTLPRCPAAPDLPSETPEARAPDSPPATPGAPEGAGPPDAPG